MVGQEFPKPARATESHKQLARWQQPFSAGTPAEVSYAPSLLLLAHCAHGGPRKENDPGNDLGCVWVFALFIMANFIYLE